MGYPEPSPGGSPDGGTPAGTVRNELPYVLSVPALVHKIAWAEQHGYDAVIQSNTFDPGVEAARLAVRIPVIGLCRTSLLVAASIAERVGITVPFNGYDQVARRLVHAYGLAHLVTAVRSLDLDGFDVPKPAIAARAVEVMRGLVQETGAECIIPLGGAVIPYIVDPAELEAEVGVPVLNTKAIGIRYTEMCVTLGLAHCASTYPITHLRLEDFAASAR